MPFFEPVLKNFSSPLCRKARITRDSVKCRATLVNGAASFSSKGRGFCPSCTQHTAAHLVERVILQVLVRLPSSDRMEDGRCGFRVVRECS